MEKIRVVLADDNTAILELVKEYFSETPDIELVCAVSDGAQAAISAIRFVRQ